MSTDSVPLSICIDCLMFFANGEVFDAKGNDITEVHGEAVDAKWDNTEITLGSVDDDEDTVDEGSFSWRDCDGCGSRLGGDRYSATAWVDTN